MKSRFDRFVDWPIKYERFGEAGTATPRSRSASSADVADQNYLGIRFTPHYSYPMPKIPLSMVDMAVETAMANLKVDGVGLDDLHWSVSSTPAARNSQPYQNRRVCAGNTNCIPICPIQAKYDPSVTLADASADRQRADAVQVGRDDRVLVDGNRPSQRH